jgi:hypothetical protein
MSNNYVVLKYKNRKFPKHELGNGMHLFYHVGLFMGVKIWNMPLIAPLLHAFI